MTLFPGYGETPLPEDELRSLAPSARELLGEPVTRAGIYDLEQAVQDDVAEELLTAAIEGDLGLDDLLVERFLRELHRRLYEDIWAWAGLFRRRELNIGVAPEQIVSELCGSLGTIRYRYQHTDDWTPRELGAVVHAEGVRIHPFTDGNGRATRLLADLVLVAAQDAALPELYDWELDKLRYIELLRQYDRHRDPRDLAAFVGVKALGD